MDIHTDKWGIIPITIIEELAAKYKVTAGKIIHMIMNDSIGEGMDENLGKGMEDTLERLLKDNNQV